MSSKINFAQLLIVAIGLGIVSGILGFAIHAVFHVDSVPLGYVLVIAAAGLVSPIYRALQDRGVMK